jgi:pimeloyl-ACP methyl ester carboxylesterase
VRQPEVRRLGALLLAVVLAVPAAGAGASWVWSGAFLVEFLSGGRVRPLTRLATAPRRERLAVPGVAADRVTRPGGAGTRLVLVHGLAPAGKNDAQLRRAAYLLARAGFDVAVPTVPGLTTGRLRPDDVDAVVATLAAGDAPTVIVAVSVGAGPALLAAADARVRDRVRLVLALGGYASAAELVRFSLTGHYRFGAAAGRAPVAADLVAAFVAANADLLDDSGRRLLDTRDPAAIEAAMAGLSPSLRALLDALSPERVVADLPAPLVLVHGRDDPAVPYTESLRLHAARPARTTVALVGVLDHVEAAPWRLAWSRVRDTLVLWGVVHRLLEAA